MRSRGISSAEFLSALGSSLDAPGTVSAPTAATAMCPVFGHPVVLGWQPPGQRNGDRRQLLLVCTQKGRYLVAVVVARPRFTKVVTVFDQDAEPHKWRACRLLPTEFGRRALPPTYWYATKSWDSTDGLRR